MNSAELNQLNNNAYRRIDTIYDKATARSERVKQYLDKLVRGFSRDGVILDVGCGPGFYINYVSSRAPTIGMKLHAPWYLHSLEVYHG